MRRFAAITALAACGAPQAAAKGAIWGVLSERPGTFANGATVIVNHENEQAGLAIADEQGRSDAGPVVRGAIEISSLRLVEGDGPAN